MKKLLCLILAALAILSLSACGADDSTPPETTEHVHDYAITENIPNCTEGGEIIGTCTCGDRYTEAIDPKEHTYSDWVVTQEPTTEAAGQKQQGYIYKQQDTDDDIFQAVGGQVLHLALIGIDQRASHKTPAVSAPVSA